MAHRKPSRILGKQPDLFIVDELPNTSEQHFRQLWVAKNEEKQARPIPLEQRLRHARAH